MPVGHLTQAGYVPVGRLAQAWHGEVRVNGSDLGVNGETDCNTRDCDLCVCAYFCPCDALGCTYACVSAMLI